MIKKEIEKMNNAYRKAETEDQYLEIIRIGEKLEKQLRAEGTYYNLAAQTINYEWSIYCLLRKSPEFASKYGKERLLKKIGDILSHLTDLNEQISFLYLQSVTLSNIAPYDFVGADLPNKKIQEIVLTGKVPILQILRYINVVGVKLAAEGDLEGAIREFEKLKEYPIKEDMDDQTRRTVEDIIYNHDAVFISLSLEKSCCAGQNRTFSWISQKEQKRI